MSETCLSFLRYLEFLRKKTSFYEKQYSAMIRFYLNANEKGKFYEILLKVICVITKTLIVSM